MPNETFGKFTITGYDSKVMNLTYNPSGTSYIGNLYYFSPTEAAKSLTWTSDLSSNKVFILAIGGGGNGGNTEGTNPGGGGGGGAFGRVDLYSLTPTSPVSLTVGNAGVNTIISDDGNFTYAFSHGDDGGDADNENIGVPGASGVFNLGYPFTGQSGGAGGAGDGSPGSNAHPLRQINFTDSSGTTTTTIYLSSGGGGGNVSSSGGIGGGLDSSDLNIGGIGGDGTNYSENGVRGTGELAGIGGFAGQSLRGGGGGGGFGGGGGGADGTETNTGGQGAAGAVFLFIVKPDPPSIPASVATFVSSTDETLTVLGNPTDASGSPFTSATFILYEDDLGITPVGSPVEVTIPNGSGNYEAEFTELSPSTNYWVKWFLTNDGGNGPPSGISATLATIAAVVTPVPSAPENLPIIVTVATNSVIVSGNPTDASGSPFTGGATFTIYSDPSGNTQVGESVTDLEIDESGNYGTTLAGLTAGTQYWVSWFLTNEGGAGPPSSLVSFTTLAPCFLRGSKILCLKDGKEEYVPIENMRAGTPVKTLNGTYVKVHIIGKSNYNNPDNVDRGPNRLFRLTPQNYPELTEDLIITGCHSRLVDKLEPKQKARHLQLMKTLYMTTGKFRLMAFIDEKAEPYQNPGKHEIWHFALENEDVLCNYGVYANGGLLVETANIKTMVERSGLVVIE